MNTPSFKETFLALRKSKLSPFDQTRTLSRKDLAQMTGYSLAAVGHWETGVRVPPVGVQRMLLSELEKLQGSEPLFEKTKTSQATDDKLA